MGSAGFLGMPEVTAAAQRHFDEDVADLGYVMNVSTLWAHDVELREGVVDLVRMSYEKLGFGVRERAILIAACASTLGDSYCSIQWGSRLAEVTDASTASHVLHGDDSDLTPAEQAMASWARKVAADPNRTSLGDVQDLRAAGFDDTQIFTITVFVAMRLAFSTVNDALGARPDAQLRSLAAPAVLEAVTFGRPIADEA